MHNKIVSDKKLPSGDRWLEVEFESDKIAAACDQVFEVLREVTSGPVEGMLVIHLISERLKKEAEGVKGFEIQHGRTQ